MKKKAFTLIELMVWISIVWIISISVANLYTKSNTDKQKLEIYTNKIIWKIDTVKNYALVWKWIGANLSTPINYKIQFSTWNYIKTFFNTWWIDNIYNELSLAPFDYPYKLKSIECKKLDLTSPTNSTWIIVTINWWNLSLTWCNNSYLKIVDFKISLNKYENTIRFNTISWVMENLKD